MRPRGDSRETAAGRTIVREAGAEDSPFLWEMLYEASFATDEPKPPRETIHQPQIERYLAEWGRPGDRALVAERDGRPVGAAWYRLFPRSDRGYGFVDDETPEVSIAVAADARGQGVGRSLLDALLQAARADGFQALSLSVGGSNHAARGLYERCGFEVVAVDETEGGVTMRAALGQSGPSEPTRSSL